MRSCFPNALREVWRWFQLLSVLLLLALPSLGIAEDKSDNNPQKSATASPAEDSEKEQDELLPEEPQPNMVSPLEVWEPLDVEPEEPDDEGIVAELGEDIERRKRVRRKYYFDLEDEEKISEQETLPEVQERVEIDPDDERWGVLGEEHRPTKSEQRRLAKIRKAYRQRVLRSLRELREKQVGDPRGPVELRVCALNAQGYGDKKIVRMRLGRKAAKQLRRLERAIVAAIDRAGCDVVALLSLLGKEVDEAQRGLTRLRESLSRKTDSKWRTLVGESEHKKLRSGFLIRGDEIEVRELVSHVDKLLPRFEVFKEKKFPVAPLELHLTVPGKEEAEDRHVVLMTAYLGSDVRTKSDKEILRMQLAEGMRQLVTYHEQQIDPEDPPILLAFVERAVNSRQASHYLLEGRLRLPEFHLDTGRCSIKPEDESFTCKGKTENTQIIRGLFANQALPSRKVRKRMKTIEEEGEKKRIEVYSPVPHSGKLLHQRKRYRREQTMEIYMVPVDLDTVLVAPDAISRYAIGTEEVNPRREESPLVWVDVNWR